MKEHFLFQMCLGWGNIFYFMGVQVFLLMLGRLSLVGLFGGNISKIVNLENGIAVFFRALQFDIKVAAVLAIPLVIMGLLKCVFYKSALLKNGIFNFIRFYSILFVFISILFIFLNIGFYQEYHSQFNVWVLGLLYDDLGAIFSTIWKSYPVIYLSIGFFAFFFLVLRIVFYFYNKFRRLIFNQFKQCSLSVCAVIFIGFSCLFLLGLRGSLASRPLKIEHRAVTPYEDLNGYVLNPYFALYGVWKGYYLLHGAGFFYGKGVDDAGLKLFWPDGQLETLYDFLFKTAYIPTEPIENSWLKKAKGPKISVRPQHIFLIVMESQDAWPLLEGYADLNLNPYLKKFAANGFSANPFLSSGYGTMGSLVALMTGLYDADLHINYQWRGMQPFATSMAPILERLGYSTRFFYGGYLTWQNVGDFARYQGFSHVIGGSEMGSLLHKDWGVDDEVLFNAIKTHLSSEDSTFNMIMTSSNHPPYTVKDQDLERSGWKKMHMPDSLVDQYDGAIDMRIFGHTRYADWAVGSFIEAVQAEFPNSLFIITGDHNSRKFLNNSPSIYERRCVPCIFYGSGFSSDAFNKGLRAGDHLDILPTLVELIGPEGFVYHSLGEDLLDESIASTAYGALFFGTEAGMGGVSSDIYEELPISLKNPTLLIDDAIMDNHKKRYQALRGIAWAQVFLK